ncbi:MAG: hydrogenase maturation nickel metallochaperone HypA [Candidatus Altiarchaeota archaeon]|nr:hydrogenase maturation nickel metallochaperone HypA [Candidatus Altiarchaeota archaeon]
MHELAVTQAIVKKTLNIWGEREGHIDAVSVEVGALTTYKKAPILLYYNILKKKHRLLVKSRLHIKVIPAEIICLKCGAKKKANDPFEAFCKNCETSKVDILKGKDIVITEVKGDVGCAGHADAGQKAKRKRNNTAAGVSKQGKRRNSRKNK